jgi:hypothetical protein
MAPGELEEHPEPGYHRALDELTEQPGPRNTWSWPPPLRAAEWVDVRPLRRTRAPTPREASAPQRNPRPRQTTTRQAFLACDHRPPLAGVKLVRPRPRPDGR